MALRLWDADPESAPKPRTNYENDVVGRARSGHQINGRPVALSKWRFTTGDPDVAEVLHEELGGEEPQEWEARGEDNLEVFTDADSIDIIISSPKSVRSEMVLWGRNNKAIRRCDGVTQGEPKDGKPCECPSAFADRKAAATEGTGCQPQITIWFKFAAFPALGTFKFQTGSWSMVKDIGPEEAKLAAIDGPARATLSLELVEYTTKAGKPVSFTKPVLKVKGAADV